LPTENFIASSAGYWLDHKRVLFALRQKQGTYIQQAGQDFHRLETLGLKPGVAFYLTQVQFTNVN
jgi:hypothetical protein